MTAIRNTVLGDGTLLEEMNLLTELVVATSRTSDRLSQQQVDEILGLTKPESQGKETTSTFVRQRDAQNG